MAICVFICRTSFEIKGLRQVLNKTKHTKTGSVLCLCTPVSPSVPERGASFFEDVPVVEFMYLIFTRVPGESYRGRLRYLLLCLCYVFRALINSLVR